MNFFVILYYFVFCVIFYLFIYLKCYICLYRNNDYQRYGGNNCFNRIKLRFEHIFGYDRSDNIFLQIYPAHEKKCKINYIA